jgi:hypothetical protein
MTAERNNEDHFCEANMTAERNNEDHFQEAINKKYFKKSMII